MVHHERDDRDPTEDPADETAIQPVIDEEPEDDEGDWESPDDDELDDDDEDDEDIL